jgi:hypothetical protein
LASVFFWASAGSIAERKAVVARTNSSVVRVAELQFDMGSFTELYGVQAGS